MSDTEIYQNSSKKRPRKNHIGGFGDYCCIPDCQSAFYDANRLKSGIALFKLPKDPALRKRRTGRADKFSKTRKVMVCEFRFNPKQIRVSLGIGRRTYLPVSVPSVFEFKPEEKRKERKPPKPSHNLETFSAFETESESSDAQCFGEVSNYFVDSPKDIDNTGKPLVENESLSCKIEHLELENKKLKEEN